MSAVRVLGDGDEAAIEEVLDQEPVINLFLRGFLAKHGVAGGAWYATERDGRLTGVLLLVHGRLMVPWCPDPGDARALGAWLARRHPPTLSVGPREAVDQVWDTWRPGVRPRMWFDQRLYRATRAAAPAPSGLRRALLHEWPLLAAHAARMEFEDLGQDPTKEDPEAHEAAVRDRIQAGRLWVLETGGEIVFQVNIGTALPDGAQVGGTYVPPMFRGRGYAKLGMAATLHQLLSHYPAVTLHVRESNTAAVRCYEAVGFEPYAPYRVVVVGD